MSARLIHENDPQCRQYSLFHKEPDPLKFCQIRTEYVDGLTSLNIMVNDIVTLYNQNGQHRSTSMPLG